MDVHITLGGPGDRADRIYRQLADAIVDGRLREGEPLPPTRELARQLEISRTTVSVAYDRLLSEGYTVARVGAGTFVAAGGARVRRRAPRGGEVQPRAAWRPPFSMEQPHEEFAYDFAIGVPDPALFPLDVWRGLVSRELMPGGALVGNADSAGYGDAAGDPSLREAIARHIGLVRSVTAGPEDVVVTSGAQQAFDLIARVLVTPGDTVAIEEPGYPPVRALFESLGARIAPVPVDDNGIIVRHIPPRARLVYTTPSHQFPTGARTSLERRAELLEWASARKGVVIEDDYDSEFRFGDRPLDPLQSLDRTGRVIYVGTFSKSLLPGLRVGFLVAPESLTPALVAAKRLSDWHGDTVTQRALARLIDGGMFAAHVRRATRVYAARRDRLLEAIDREFGDAVRVVPSVAGLHVGLEFAPVVQADGRRIADAARADGIGVRSFEDFAAGPSPRRGLVIGYGVVQFEHIDDGVRRLGQVIRRHSHLP
jgi:GntR family transcriptional regulator/MocR family aminotransferase